MSFNRRDLGFAVFTLVLGAVVSAHWGKNLMVAEKIQLAFAIATLPWALGFIWEYAKDPWYKTWFGRSLMMIAVAVLLASASAIMFRLFGPDYWGRPALLVGSSALTFAAMSTRTLVLRWLQAHDKSPL
jgi:hypothetical protein